MYKPSLGVGFGDSTVYSLSPCHSAHSQQALSSYKDELSHIRLYLFCNFLDQHLPSTNDLTQFVIQTKKGELKGIFTRHSIHLPVDQSHLSMLATLSKTVVFLVQDLFGPSCWILSSILTKRFFLTVLVISFLNLHGHEVE